MPIRFHEENPSLFREAIRHTSAETGFIPPLIEKDYFWSVLLEYLAARSEHLTFKGGTCLAKIHIGFYRLSEDLDFSISTPVQSPRSERKRRAASFKKVVENAPTHLPEFRVVEPLTGANNSTQYNAVLGYESLLDSHIEQIDVEISLREPHLMGAERGDANTVLTDPVTGQALVGAFPVRCLSYGEAMAEKLRAALCRREVAIRDFFDIDYAVRNARLDTRAPGLLDLVRRKVEIPGTGPVNTSPDRMAQLRGQMETKLQPVLREQEYTEFELERAINTVLEVAHKVSSRK